MARTVFSNKKAYHDFTIVDKLETGIVLEGWEVKSIKNGMGDFRGAFAVIDAGNQLLLRGVNVASWKTGLKQAEDTRKRERKLLAHRREIAKLQGLASRPGYTLIPLEVFISNRGLIKVVIAVVKGKRQYEKKQAVKDRDMKRKMRQELGDI